MSYFKHFRCSQCETEYTQDSVRYLCPKCSADYVSGMPLKGILEAVYDNPAIASAWKEYLSTPSATCVDDRMKKLSELFSPVDRVYYPILPVGNTPLIETHRLSQGALYLKYDGVNPSGSFKDRASQLVVAEALRLGIKEIVAASTGNAASSLAALCAAAGLKAVIFAPASAPQAKLVQIQVHGAVLNKVNGTYDDAFAAALQYSASHECLNRNTAYHPYTIEGKKTAGLELFIQMGSVPDAIVIPVGDGVILSGIYKAFKDLKLAGIVEKLPVLVAAQAASSDSITRYWESGVYNDADSPNTIADSISVKTPSAAHLAYKALKESNGFCFRVSDDEIRKAQRVIAEQCGVFCEPSSSATLAAYSEALEAGLIGSDWKTVLLLTGHGLKDIQAVQLDT